MFTDPTCFYVTIFKRLQDQIPHYKICDQAENKKGNIYVPTIFIWKFSLDQLYASFKFFCNTSITSKSNEIISMGINSIYNRIWSMLGTTKKRKAARITNPIPGMKIFHRLRMGDRNNKCTMPNKEPQERMSRSR